MSKIGKGLALLLSGLTVASGGMAGGALMSDSKYSVELDSKEQYIDSLKAQLDNYLGDGENIVNDSQKVILFNGIPFEEFSGFFLYRFSNSYLFISRTTGNFYRRSFDGDEFVEILNSSDLFDFSNYAPVQVDNYLIFRHRMGIESNIFIYDDSSQTLSLLTDSATNFTFYNFGDYILGRPNSGVYGFLLIDLIQGRFKFVSTEFSVSTYSSQFYHDSCLYFYGTANGIVKYDIENDEFDTLFSSSKFQSFVCAFDSYFLISYSSVFVYNFDTKSFDELVSNFGDSSSSGISCNALGGELVLYSQGSSNICRIKSDLTFDMFSVPLNGQYSYPYARFGKCFQIDTDKYLFFASSSNYKPILVDFENESIVEINQTVLRSIYSSFSTEDYIFVNCFAPNNANDSANGTIYIFKIADSSISTNGTQFRGTLNFVKEANDKILFTFDGGSVGYKGFAIFNKTSEQFDVIQTGSAVGSLDCFTHIYGSFPDGTSSFFRYDVDDNLNVSVSLVIQ